MNIYRGKILSRTDRRRAREIEKNGQIQGERYLVEQTDTERDIQKNEQIQGKDIEQNG